MVNILTNSAPPPGVGVYMEEINKYPKNEEEIRVSIALQNEEEKRRRWGKEIRILAKISNPSFTSLPWFWRIPIRWVLFWLGWGLLWHIARFALGVTHSTHSIWEGIFFWKNFIFRHKKYQTAKKHQTSKNTYCNDVIRLAHHPVGCVSQSSLNHKYMLSLYF